MNQQRPRGQRPSLPSPSNGTLGAVVAVVALVLGFLILRDIKNDPASTSGNGGTAPATETVPGGGTASPTSAPAFSINGFKIQVANASGLAGSAGAMTTALQNQGYVVQPALNVPPGTAKRAKTGVFYLAGCEAAADNVKTVLGGDVEVAVMPTPVPVETGTIGEACILILLGTDLAGKPLKGVVGSGNGSAATTAAPAATGTTVAG